MARQNLGTGSTANDGTGDTLRAAATKINSNFVELYQKLGGDSDLLSGELSVTANGIQFEGTTDDNFETTLKAVDPDSDRTIRLPNADGEIITDSATQTIINKTLISPVLGAPQIHDLDSSHQYILKAGSLTSDHNVTIPSLTDSDTFTFLKSTQTLENKTLDSATINNPAITGKINDVNGAELLKVTATASAVNEVTLTNAATAGKPELAASGSDTDINLKLSPKGLGSVEVQKIATTVTEMTSAGTAPSATSYVIINIGTASAIGLADGTTVGEQKIFTNKGAGIATITPTSFGPGADIVLDQNDGCILIWDNTDWQIIGQYGATVV